MTLTIAEVSRRTGLTAHTLRYYERDGLLLSVPRRDPTGHRVYDETDVDWLTILARLRATAMPIRDIRRYAELARQGDGTTAERMAILRAHRDRVRVRIEEDLAHLAAIDVKIDVYAGRLENAVARSA